MKIVYFGTPDFAVLPLKKLIDAGHEICAVVTGADKPKGRGYELAPTPVKEEALKHSIKVIHPVKMKDPDFLAELEAFKADVFVVVAYGRIIPKQILDMPPKGCINVHGSLLPAYRGAAPIQWAVIDGLKETGVTTMQMDEGLDTGDILRQYKYELQSDETGGSLFDRLAQIGADAIADTLANLDDITPVKQGDTTTDYARMLTKADGKIDWNRPAEEIERLIRGLNPWPSAFSSINGKMCKIWSAEITDIKGNPGEVVFNDGKRLAVACADKALFLNEIQLEGKKRMPVDALLRGYSIEKGTYFGKE